MSGYTVTTSAELMENYIQSDVLLPQDKFIALQTESGASLLFSIGTGGVFNLTMEVPGTNQGWQLADLSTAQIKLDYPNGATCKNFAAAQAVGQQPGTPAQIHLAMVVNDGTNDHLYVSLSNSDSDLSWAKNPVWTSALFNAVDGTGAPITPPSPFEIAGVLISEATDKEYVLVDIVRNPTEPVGVLERFYIDSTPPVWSLHDFATDIQASGYSSCLGRSAKAFGVDGIYTMGMIGPSAQLIYVPLYNAFKPTMPPLSCRLNLPGGLAADAIAASRNPDNSSDLYVVSQGGLYYFASTNQHDGAVGVQLVTNGLLSGVRTLYAYLDNGIITAWGLNGSDQVFYLTCNQAQITNPSAWNLPLPIQSNVDAISPYIDRMFNANTFFAHSGTGLIKVVKSPTTGLWMQTNITLPPSEVLQDSKPISTYTTHIQVTDSNGQVATDIPVTLTASTLTSVYINHLYYIIGPEPIQVNTDELGTITIIELIQTMSGTRFTAVVNQQPSVPINPMDTAMQRNSQYDSVSNLQNAVIVNRDGTTRPFVPAGTSDDALKLVAQSNQNLGKAYSSVSNSPAPTVRRPMTMQLAGTPGVLVDAGFGDSILSDIGDLFSWLASGIEYIVQLVEDAAEGVWYFVVSIGQAVYHAILDCVEAVVAAATWIYNAIKVLIEDIIKFLEFLFAWQDIITTHNVLKNVFIQLSQSAIDGLTTSKGDIAAIFTQLQSDINKWADIPGFNQTPAGTSGSNPPLSGQNGAPANLGVHHFQGNCSASETAYSPPNPAEAIFQDLMDLMSNEKDTLMGAFSEIKTQIIDPFMSLSVSEIIKRFVAIIADTILQTAENVLVTLLDVLIQLVTGLMDALTATIDIPVLSWLYKLLTGNDLSFLDLMCLIGAIPVTLIYKATADAAPFPRGDAFTEGLINAASLAEIQALFVVSQPTLAQKGLAYGEALLESDDDPVMDQDKLKTFGIVAGIAALVGSLVLVVCSAIQKTFDLIGIPCPFAKKLAAIICVGNVLYVSPNISTLINATTDNWYANLNNVLTGISIVKGMVAIPLADTDNKVIKMMFPAVETVINVIWNVPVIANIVVNTDVWDTTYKSLIPESIGNFAFNIGGILELPIALTEPPTNLELFAAQAISMVTYGVFMVIAGGIYEWAPDQHH